MSAGWKTIRWAKTVPPMIRKDGRADAAAHHVLLVLATFADKDGSARPGLSTLARETYLVEETVAEALRRLVRAGLIEQGGSFNGTTVWRLNLSVTRGPDSGLTAEERRERVRAQAAERARRYRKNRSVTVSDAVTRHGVSDRDVTPSDTVTNGHRHGLPHREVTACHTVTSRCPSPYVTGSPPLQPQVTKAVTAIELPTELPEREHTLPAQPQEPLLMLVPSEEKRPRKRPSAGGYTADFEAFWAAYGRKGYKPKAAAEWHKALTRTTRDVIMATVGPYVLSTPNPRFRKGAESWLHGDGWESLIIPAAASGDYQPYRNSTPDAYEGDLL